MEFETSLWLDDIICVTNGSAEDLERGLREVLSNLEKAGYRASAKTELFKKELTWLGYYMNQNGVKPIKDKTEAITKIKAPKNVTEMNIPGFDSALIQIYNQPLQENKRNEKTAEERYHSGVDSRNKLRLRKSEQRNH